MANNKKRKSNNDKQNRNSFGNTLMFLAIIIFLLLGFRFLYISVGKHVQGINLNKATQQLYMREQLTPAQRGTIYDAEGNPIAENTNKYSVYAIVNKSQRTSSGKPMYVTDESDVINVLHKNLKISKSAIIKTLHPKNKQIFQVEFGPKGRNISEKTKKAIEKHHLNGIYFSSENARIYPNSNFANYLIGFTASVMNKKYGQSSLVGRMGLEKQFNKQLSGIDGLKSDTSNSSILSSDGLDQHVKNGDNIYTTIDPDIESLMENQVNNVYKKLNAKNVIACLINVKNGKILAAAQRPTFNPNNSKGLSKEWNNLLISEPFEPGSIMKTICVAAAINSHHYRGKQLYLSGQMRIGDAVVPDWQQTGWGYISFDKGFLLSSNVAMAKLEQKMGAKVLLKYIKKFGFLKPTNVGLPDESSGSTNYKVPIDQANTAFGQGITVTPMQMIQAYTAFANNGYMIKPYLVDKITDSNNKVIKRNKRTVIGHPISKKTAEHTLHLLTEYVSKSYALGHFLKMKEYKVAAKTGIAQIVGTNGKYMSGYTNTVNSICALVPANKPKYMMFISVRQPDVAYKPLDNALFSIFKPVIMEAMSKESENSGNSQLTMPKVINLVTQDAENELKQKKLNPVILGNGSKILKQYPQSNTSVLKKQNVFIYSGGEITMPNMKSWSVHDVLIFERLTGIKVKIVGNGIVNKQNIPANTVLKKSTKIRVSCN